MEGEISHAMYTLHSIKVDSLKVDPTTKTHFFKKAPAGMLTTQKHNFSIKKGSCGHADNAKVHFYHKKAPAGMLTTQKIIFSSQKSPCGHADSAKIHVFNTRRPLRAR